MVNILFITYHDFTSNSAIQIHNFANMLTRFGNKCCVAVPSNEHTVYEAIGGEVSYTPLNYSDTLKSNNLFGNGKGPDIIHAWTPREIVRKQCTRLLNLYRCKLIVHLEDNEELILENALSVPIKRLKLLPVKKLDQLIPDTLSHPILYKEFLSMADGITVIIDRLADFIPENKKFLILWPGLDKIRFNSNESDSSLKNKIGIEDDNCVICYTGNVHSSNAHEVRSLYLAVALLNREGIPTRLIRTGKDYVSFLGDNKEWAHRHSIELGFVPHQEIPLLLSLADVLVQPGKTDKFNEYRLPSKLPEFFAMGKPVILPKVNVGLFVKNYEEALVMDKGDALEIIDKIKLVLNDKKLYNQLSRGGRLFAMKMFDLDRNTKKLEEFYLSVLK